MIFWDMGSASERRRYNVTSSLIAGAHAQVLIDDIWFTANFSSNSLLWIHNLTLAFRVHVTLFASSLLKSKTSFFKSVGGGGQPVDASVCISFTRGYWLSLWAGAGQASACLQSVRMNFIPIFLKLCRCVSWHYHDDVIKWKYFTRYWPFVVEISGTFHVFTPRNGRFHVSAKNAKEITISTGKTPT